MAITDSRGRQGRIALVRALGTASRAHVQNGVLRVLHDVLHAMYGFHHALDGVRHVRDGVHLVLDGVPRFRDCVMP